ncbi:hypothetical protein KJ969_05615 [Patescibacteria group bacterium]|nr:hypothetical protein [Patescibacteria group bacterium]
MTSLEWCKLTWEWLVVLREWLVAETRYEASGLNDALGRARKVINIPKRRAVQWWNWARKLAVWGTIISLTIFVIGIFVGGKLKAGWPNSITGLLIAPILFVFLVWWTPLVAIVTIILEIAHGKIRGATDAGIAQAKGWLGLICGILLWQVLLSLAFSLIPYWNAPSRIPLLMLLALTMALIGIRWNSMTWYRGIIKFLVIGIFIAQILVCFFPATSLAIHFLTGKVDRSLAGKIENGNLFPAKAKSDTIVLSSGIYAFDLVPGETNQWITVKEGHRYSFSSSTANDPTLQSFFLIYKNGKMIKVDRADVTIPPGPGPFRLMAGENGAYIKLLVVKKTT